MPYLLGCLLAFTVPRTLDEEKEQIDMIFNNAIDILSDEDKQLPQVQNQFDEG